MVHVLTTTEDRTNTINEIAHPSSTELSSTENAHTHTREEAEDLQTLIQI